MAHLEKRIEALEDELKRANGCEEDTKMDERSPSYTTSLQSAHGMISPVDAQEFSTISFPSNRSFSSKSNDQFGASPGGIYEPPPRLIETITTEPRGKPFGIDVLRQLCNHTNQLSQPSEGLVSSMRLVQALDNNQAADIYSDSSTSNPYLPPKEVALQLISNAFSEAFHLWPFVDRAQVDSTIYRLYNTSTFGQEPGDQDNLALVHALLALGQRFDMASNVGAGLRKTQGWVSS